MIELRRFIGYAILGLLSMLFIFMVGVILKVSLVLFLKGWSIL